LRRCKTLKKYCSIRPGTFHTSIRVKIRIVFLNQRKGINMDVSIGFAITMFVTPMVLLKTYLQSRELKDLRRRLGIKK
jgi:hypothetical protein